MLRFAIVLWYRCFACDSSLVSAAPGFGGPMEAYFRNERVRVHEYPGLDPEITWKVAQVEILS